MRTPPLQEVELQRLGLADLPGGSATRLVHHNTELGHPRTFATNSVTTAKYNVATFLPRFLFEVFSQVAYFYFLVQVREPGAAVRPPTSESRVPTVPVPDLPMLSCDRCLLRIMFTRALGRHMMSSCVAPLSTSWASLLRINHHEASASA